MKKSTKKVLSLVLCSAIIASGMGVQKTSNYASAAQKTEAVSGTAVDTEATEEPTETPTAEATIKPTEVPTPSATVIPTVSPSVPTTHVAVTSTAVTGAYVKGDTFKSGNFLYSVTKPGTKTTQGRIKVVRLVVAARTKSTVSVPSTVTKLGNTYKVTAIAKQAFVKSTALKTVKIGSNVEVIGTKAFKGLRKLTYVTLGAKVNTIGEMAFAGCYKMHKITLSERVKNISTKAFYNCKKLKAVVVDSKKITKIKTAAFSKVKTGCTVIVPASKTTKYTKLFASASNKKLTVATY